MTSPLFSEKIYETLSLLTGLTRDLPAYRSADPLDQLFETMRGTEDPQIRAESEDLIWALWCSHEVDGAHRSMQKAIGAMNRRDFEEAKGLLDRLVEEWPRWAETWNKRATVHFLEERYLESIEDIQHTLTLEPRHFGAASGFGQICLRASDEHAALMAFDYALEINPNLTAVRDTAELLRGSSGPIVH